MGTLIEDKARTVLVIGAGIGGIRASLDLAESGFKVYLCDRSPVIGGALLHVDKWFPDDHCGMCRVLPLFASDEFPQFCLRRGLIHPDIELMPLTGVERLEGEAGDFSITLRVHSPWVKQELCIGCGLCEEVCPVEVKDEFNQGIANHKAIHSGHPLSLSKAYVIDRASCTRCEACVEKCPTRAIDLSLADEVRRLGVGAIILSTGFGEFDPRPATQYGYGRYPNVVTSMELERLLSGASPSQGKLIRPSDGKAPKSIAFLQCVGSRTTERNYCSSACCMYAIKEAMLIKERSPESEVCIFFMDLQTFGKGYYRYYRKAEEEFGVSFNRLRIPRIKENRRNGNLTITTVTEDGRLVPNHFELVVLSTGQTSPPQFQEVSRILGVNLNEWGFCKTKGFSPTETTRKGIYACGSASGPKDIADTLAEGSAAACQASILLRPSRNKPPAPDYIEESRISEEEPRVGVFLCSCGEEMAEVIDTKELAGSARNLPAVVYVEDIPYLCRRYVLAEVEAKIKEQRINRAVFAGCSALSLWGPFREALKRTRATLALVEMVNLREEVCRVHKDRPLAAREKGKALIAMALEKVKLGEVFPSLPQLVEPRALVIGGGLSGLTAALSIAEQGFEVDLVEKSIELGGNSREIYSVLEEGDPQALIEGLIQRVEASPLIHVRKETEVVEVSGLVGNFCFTLQGKNAVLHRGEAGAIIVATGARESQPTEYLYGQSGSIITQKELGRRLFYSEVNPETLKSVAMVQCVGSMSNERPYCSRICCSQALNNALDLKQRNPEVEVVIFYRHMMSYGFKEERYTEAREKGVIFIRYEPERKPEVNLEDEGLTVKAIDPVLGGKIVLEPDLVVLSPAIIPRDNSKLAQLLEVELNEDGFFQEAEAKFLPVDFLKAGIFVCGLAHSPRGIGESASQAQAAAQRAASILSKGKLESRRMVSEVNERWCRGCELCVTVCPYKARVKDLEKGIVVVREALCQGCGACAVACPSGAAKLRGFKEKQVLSMIDVAV